MAIITLAGNPVASGNPFPVTIASGATIGLAAGTQTVGTVLLGPGTAAIGSVSVSNTVTTNQNGLSGIRSSQASVTTTAAQLASTPLANRVSMQLTSLISNTGTIYYGGAGVTTSTGVPLMPGQTASLDANAACGVYAIASATSTIAILEMAP